MNMQSRADDYQLFGISCKKGLEEEAKFHTHFQYEINLFHGGKCRFIIDNKIYDMQPGDVVVLDGSLMHRPFVYDDRENYERSIVQFSKDWILPVLKTLKAEYLLEPFEKNHFRVFRQDDPAVNATIEGHVKKIEAYLSENQYDTNTIELKLELVHILLGLQKLKLPTELLFQDQLDEKYRYVQEVSQYVQLHFNEKITLDGVADYLSLSKSYLVHLFKDLTGETIMDYIKSYRIKQAVQMMAVYPNYTLREISSQCGFENESNFSRSFKKKMGYAPNEYRKKFYPNKKE